MITNKKDNNTKISQGQAQEILNAIHAITGDSQVLRWKYGNAEFHNPHNLRTKENCPFSTPVNLVEDYVPSRERKRVDPEERFEDFALSARGGMIPNKIIKATAKKWVEQSPAICIVRDGVKTFMEASAKSSPRYNKKYYWKIHDHAKILAEQGYKPYFLTVTNDPKRYKYDFVAAWKGFHANCGRMLKNLCRKYDAFYECVYEAQKSGNPHAHVVLWFKEFFADDKITKAKNKIFISGGDFKEYLRTYEPSMGFMELRRGGDKDPINYLLKYISKATSRDFYAMARDSNRLKDSDRKDLLSALLPVISRTRQFSMSQGVFPDEPPSVGTVMSRPDETRAPREFGSASEARDYLKKLCNNFPLPCQSLVRMFRIKQLYPNAVLSPRELTKLSPARKDELYGQGRCVGCKGCIITHFLNYINTGSDPWFDALSAPPVQEDSTKEEEGGLLASYFEENDAINEGLVESPDKAKEFLTEDEYATTQWGNRKEAMFRSVKHKSNLMAFSMMTNDEELSVHSAYHTEKEVKGWRRSRIETEKNTQPYCVQRR